MRLLPLFLFFWSTLARPEDCRDLGHLNSFPSAQIFFVSADSLLTRKFYYIAKCWLPSKRVRLYLPDEDYSHFHSTPSKFVLSNYSNAEQIIRMNASEEWSTVVLLPCHISDDCSDPKVEVWNGIPVIHSATPLPLAVSKLIISGKEWEQDTLSDDLYNRQYKTAINAGVLLCLVVFFLTIACVISCNSVWMLTLIFDDYYYWKEHMAEEEDFNAPLPESPPMNLGAQPARSELFELDKTQASVSCEARSDEESLMPLHLLGSPFFDPSASRLHF